MDNHDKYSTSNLNSDIEDEESLKPENSKTDYSIENIKVERVQFSIFELKRRYDRRKNSEDYKNTYVQGNLKNHIILDSAFQREEVWDRKQESELIESVLIGLPLPLMYFYEDKNANLIVVDGRQRLTAFFKYMDNKYSLSELTILKEVSGKKFEELETILQSKLEDFQLLIQIIKPPTPDTVKFQIFDRINRGGTQLNNQEMRNALYQGNSCVLLKTLAESEQFLKATNEGINPKRMRDKYVILRAIAFYLLRKNMLKNEDGILLKYKGGLDDLLGKAMEFLNFQDVEFLNRIEKEFLSAMEMISKTLNKEAFRLTATDKRRSPINMNVFEVWTYLMMLLNGEETSCIDFEQRYKSLITNGEFLDSIANHRDSAGKVDIRFNMVEKIYKEVIDND